jgi:hypothetical protein
LLGLVALTLGFGSPIVPSGAARLDYRMECVLDGAPDRLVVDMEVNGLDPAMRDLAFEMPLWGEWIGLDEYYITRVRGEPCVHHDLDNRFYWRPELTEDWDGRLAMHYEIPIVALGSEAQREHGLLPWRAATYVQAYSANTLVRLLVGAEFQDGDRHLELVAPAALTIATGWGGDSKERQVLALAPDADNTILFFGEPVASQESSGAGGRIQVVQFGRAADRTALVLDLAQAVRAAFDASTGVEAPADEHIFITEPGFGGTHTDGAVVIGHPNVEANGRPDVGTDHFIAHELFHAWLPGVLGPGEDGLEWFFEGFTDYLSLWHLASLGRITPQEFVDRLRVFDLMLHESPAAERISFADRTVNWREPAAETVAYKGGALLAFHLDAALRASGKPGLPQLFRDLCRGERATYTLARLREWVVAQGLEEFWRAYVEGVGLPVIEDALVRIGCSERIEGTSRILEVEEGVLASFLRFEPTGR